MYGRKLKSKLLFAAALGCGMSAAGDAWAQANEPDDED